MVSDKAMISATGTGGKPLFDLSPGGVTLKVTAVRLGDAAAPKGCSLSKTGDLWLEVTGSVSLAFPGLSGTVGATGCFDLTSGNFTLTATFSQLSFSALTENVSFSAPTPIAANGPIGRMVVPRRAA